MLKFPFVLHRLAGSKHQFSPSLHSTELQRHDGTLGELAAVPLVFAHFLIWGDYYYVSRRLTIPGAKYSEAAFLGYQVILSRLAIRKGFL